MRKSTRLRSNQEEKNIASGFGEEHPSRYTIRVWKSLCMFMPFFSAKTLILRFDSNVDEPMQAS